MVTQHPPPCNCGRAHSDGTWLVMTPSLIQMMVMRLLLSASVHKHRLQEGRSRAEDWGMLGVKGTITPLGQALGCHTKGQQQFYSKQAINRVIMHHVPEHLHSHLLALLSLTAVDGNWIKQWAGIGNIFHSEQNLVSEDSRLSPCACYPPAVRHETAQMMMILLPLCLVVLLTVVPQCSVCTLQPYVSMFVYPEFCCNDTLPVFAERNVRSEMMKCLPMCGDIAHERLMT